MFKCLEAFFLIKDKKYEEALGVIPSAGSKLSNSQCVLTRAQLFLALKKNKECVQELIKHVMTTPEAKPLIPIVFKFASNYKLTDLPEF